ARIRLRSGAADRLPDSAAARIVGSGEAVAAAIPGADGFAGRIVQHPACAGFHAEFVDAVAEHVISVLHDTAAEEIAGLPDGVAQYAATKPWMSGSVRGSPVCGPRGAQVSLTS